MIATNLLMRRKILFFILLIILLISIPLFIWSRVSKTEKMPKNLPAPTVTIPQKLLLIKGSIPYWDQEKALLSFEKNIETFNYVNLFWYYLSPNGDINKYEYANEDLSIIEFAHQNNVKVGAVITNLPEFSGADWNDSGLVEKVIRDKNKSEEHIKAIINKLNEVNFDGVIIDYEQLDTSAKNDFTNFIRDLSSAVHKNNKFLSVVLHPKTSDNNPDENGKFQDWKQLSLYADQIQIMGYGEHWDNSLSGPIASVSWLKRILDYSKSVDIPKEKIFLGIPLYGYDWDTSSGENATDLTYQDVEKLLLDFNIKEEWDDKSQSSYFNYTDKNNHKHEVWFENQRSIEAKINIAKSYDLSGITFWRLGEEDPRIWSIIRL